MVLWEGVRQRLGTPKHRTLRSKLESTVAESLPLLFNALTVSSGLYPPPPSLYNYSSLYLSSSLSLSLSVSLSLRNTDSLTLTGRAMSLGSLPAGFLSSQEVSGCHYERHTPNPLHSRPVFTGTQCCITRPVGRSSQCCVVSMYCYLSLSVAVLGLLSDAGCHDVVEAVRPCGQADITVAGSRPADLAQPGRG